MRMQIRSHPPGDHARPSLVVRPFSRRREPISTPCDSAADAAAAADTPADARSGSPPSMSSAARSIPGSGAAPAPRPRNAYYAQLHPKPPPPDAWRRYNFGELSRGR